MSAKNSILSGFLLLVLVAGAYRSWNSISELRRTAAADKARDEKTIARLQEENQRQRSQSAAPLALGAAGGKTEPMLEPGVQRREALGFITDLMTRGNMATPDSANFLRQLATRPPNSANLKIAPMPAYMIDASGALGPGFADFFGLNDGERNRLDDGLAALEGDIERAVQANATVTRKEDGSIVVEVKPVDGAAGFRDRFTSLFQETLGPERYGFFTRLNSPRQDIGSGPIPAGITGNLNLFGEATGTYVLKHTPTSYSSDTKIKAGASQEAGGGGGGIAVTSEAFRDMMIKSRGVVMKLLPADF